MKGRDSSVNEGYGMVPLRQKILRLLDYMTHYHRTFLPELYIFERFLHFPFLINRLICQVICAALSSLMKFDLIVTLRASHCI